MNLKKILVPVDFSTGDETVLKLATALARDSQARLVIAHVVEPPLAYGGGEMYYGVPEPSLHDLKEMLANVKPTDAGVSYEHRLVTGDPASAIVELAASDGADLIVIGTHGRTCVGRLLMGSVAEAVVRKAPCPVLSCKQNVATPAHAR